MAEEFGVESIRRREGLLGRKQHRQRGQAEAGQGKGSNISANKRGASEQRGARAKETEGQPD